MQMVPVSPQGSIVSNGIYDRHFYMWRTGHGSASTMGQSIFPKSTSPDNFSLMQRELAFRLSDSANRYIGRPSAGGVNDVALKVFSSFNNYPAFVDLAAIDACFAGAGQDGPELAKLTKQLVLGEFLQFVGVPLTSIYATNPDGIGKDTVGLCAGGSTTIINTGERRIEAGQAVAFEIPLVEGDRKTQITSATTNGEPQQKVLASTVPYTKADLTADAAMFVNAFQNDPSLADNIQAVMAKHTLSALYKSLAVVKGAMSNPSMLYAAVRGMLESRGRVIGTALSSARPGYQLDIMIKGGL